VGKHLALAVLAAAIGAAESRAWAGDPSECAPAATVDGGGSARGLVLEELRARGIRTSAPAGCAVVTAQLAESPDGLVVGIVDEYGRTSERHANGPAAAATVIESWVRSDLSASLLTARNVSPPALARSERIPRSTAPAVDTEPALAMPATASSKVPGSGISFSASAESSIATDGSLWLGVNAGLCFQIGAVCAGALVRVSNDAAILGESREMQTGRLGTDVLLGAALPIRKGRLTMLPGVAVGVGWLRTTALNAAPDPTQSDGVDVDGGGLRASASLRLSLAVTRSLAIDLGMAADVAPVAHTSEFKEGQALMAGEPRGFIRGGLGVRLGLL
jgi:hypothetical protein